MKGLVWLCTSPTPYNDFLFSTLHKSDIFNLEVIYREVQLNSYPWKSKSGRPYLSRKLLGLLGFDYQLIKRILFDKNVTFVVGGWHPKFWFIMLVLSLKTSNFMIWCDTPNDLHKRGFLKSIVRNFLLELIFKNSSAILGTGKVCVDRLIAMGASSDKVFNFPYWVPTKDEYSRLHREDSKVVRVISVGRLISVKGFAFLVAAATVVRETNPLLKIEYVICGDGVIRHELSNLIETNGLSEIFSITGWLENDQIADELLNADIYVHTAIWEPYGVSVLEAMAVRVILWLLLIGSKVVFRALSMR